MTDTIFALASGAGRAGIAVVRASGPDAGRVLSVLADGLPAPRRAALRALTGPDGTTIDKALLLWFPGPASFTGEDVAEFHIHGGPAVIAALIEALMAEGLYLFHLPVFNSIRMMPCLSSSKNMRSM